jgi:hypothetical protein
VPTSAPVGQVAFDACSLELRVRGFGRRPRHPRSKLFDGLRNRGGHLSGVVHLVTAEYDWFRPDHLRQVLGILGHEPNLTTGCSARPADNARIGRRRVSPLIRRSTWAHRCASSTNEDDGSAERSASSASTARGADALQPLALDNPSPDLLGRSEPGMAGEAWASPVKALGLSPPGRQSRVVLSRS